MPYGSAALLLVVRTAVRHSRPCRLFSSALALSFSIMTTRPDVSRAVRRLAATGGILPVAVACQRVALPVLLLGVLLVEPDEVPVPPGTALPPVVAEPPVEELPVPAPVPVPDPMPELLPVAVPLPASDLVVPGTVPLSEPVPVMPDPLAVAPVPEVPVPLPLSDVRLSMVAEPGAPVPAPGDCVWEPCVVGVLLRSQAASAIVATTTIKGRASIVQPASLVIFLPVIEFS